METRTEPERKLPKLLPWNSWRPMSGESASLDWHLAERDAIVLRHVVGLSYDEIGEVLNRPAGTAKSDVYRGLERLRTMINTEELG